MHLKQELKLAKKAKQLERVAIIEAVLEDGDLLELVNEANIAEYEYVRDSREKAAVYGNSFTDFFQFLIENREAIMEMILMFVQLFAVLQPAPTK
jgi:hypothetical protein